MTRPRQDPELERIKSLETEDEAIAYLVERGISEEDARRFIATVRRIQFDATRRDH